MTCQTFALSLRYSNHCTRTPAWAGCRVMTNQTDKTVVQDAIAHHPLDQNQSQEAAHNNTRPRRDRRGAATAKKTEALLAEK